MSKLIDVSVPIAEDLPTWPGDPTVRVEPAKRISRGDAANVSLISLGNHTGTHVDPPSHFVEGGASIDELSPDIFVGPAWVAHLPDVEGEISLAYLDAAGIPSDVERLLLRTSNSGKLRRGQPVLERFVTLSVEGARWAVQRGLKLVGIDYLSIERPDAPKEHPVHRTLLENGVIIVEGLDLSNVPEGEWELLCLPILLAGGDGAPARAFVRLPG